MTTPEKPSPPRQGWLDRIMAAGPRTRRWATLAMVWVVVTPGAFIILFQPNERLSQAANFEEKIQALRIEDWLAFVLVFMHLLFINLAWMSYLNERQAGPPAERK